MFRFEPQEKLLAPAFRLAERAGSVKQGWTSDAGPTDDGVASSVETAVRASGHGLTNPDLELVGQIYVDGLPESVVWPIFENAGAGAKRNAQALAPTM